MRFSKDVLALNPQLTAQARRAARGQDDVADVLYAELCRHAKDIWLNAAREWPFGTFRIDIAIPSRMVAVEVDGGQHKPGGGKHGGARDYQKTRQLALAGWLVLRFTAGEVRNDPLACIADIRQALELRIERR